MQAGVINNLQVRMCGERSDVAFSNANHRLKKLDLAVYCHRNSPRWNVRVRLTENCFATRGGESEIYMWYVIGLRGYEERIISPQLQSNVYAAAECCDPRSGVHLGRS